MKYRHLIAVTVCLVAAVPVHARAAAADQAARRWKQVDSCVEDANKQVPDHNEAALRKRDALVNECLKEHGLPPRSGLAPSDGDQAAPKPATPAVPPS